MRKRLKPSFQIHLILLNGKALTTEQRLLFVPLVLCIVAVQNRKYLIDNNYIECIIQLPDNLFYVTSIAICIMVLKKFKVDNQTLFIDASKEFVKSTNSNKLGMEHQATSLITFRIY